MKKKKIVKSAKLCTNNITNQGEIISWDKDCTLLPASAVAKTVHLKRLESGLAGNANE